MIILASDIGSTTTKVVVFELSGGSFTAVASVQEPTTVEPPFSDVTVGLFRAVARLAKSTGLVLMEGNSLKVPYFTTSSAGGGLQMIVIGYTMSDSLRIAETTAYSAGAIISGAFSMDCSGERLDQIERMSRINPDLVLMAGGTDGGAISGPVNMAHQLSMAAPEPKYGSGSLPLLFCGNVGARKYVREALGDHFDMRVTENVSPGSREINPRPAIAAVQDLFMDHVMKRAPGYPELLKLVSAPIVPTPVGVANILKASSSALGIGAMLVDMGGATTDIFTVSNGNLERTVAANIGMSFSMTNTISEAGLPAIMQHVSGASSESIRSWAMSKSLFPSTIPDSSTVEDIEASVAVEGMRVAWSHHLEVAYDTGILTWREILSPRRPSAINPVLETLSGKRFKLDELGMLIGAGGIFSHSSPRRVAWLLAEAFRPPGLTTLYVDTDFRSPHMGTLMQKYPEEALEFYMRNCIRPVCRVLSPVFVTNGKFAVVTGPLRRKTVRSGEFLFFPDTSGMSVKVFDHSIAGVESVCDGLPLLIDCRKNAKPLPLDFLEGPQGTDEQITLPVRAVPQLTRQQIGFSMSLPCEGILNVTRGSKVSTGECLGQVKEVPPRHFVIDVRGSLCCPSDLSDAEIRKAITVSRGTTVNTGDILFEHFAGQYKAMLNSPVSGIVKRIISPGIIMLEEDMTHDCKPHVIQLSRRMGVHPRKMKRYLRAEVGDFVYKSNLIACDPRVTACLAPYPGFVTEIDHKHGTITIQYNMTPIRIESPLAATVVSTASRRAVSLISSGLKLSGVLGFGKTVRGTLHPLAESSPHDIAFVSNSADSAILSLAAEKGVAGLICPSIAANTLVNWLGREPGIFITGQEETPFSLMILSGIGSTGVDAHVLDSLSLVWGNHSALFPETKIRAGIHRPFLAISPG